MKVCYLDESGDHSLVKIDPQFPAFCLAGCIVDDIDFYKHIDPKIDDLKIKYFKSSDIIFHSRDIRKRQPPFQSLMQKQIREHFLDDLNKLITDTPMTIIAAVILKLQHKQQYSDPANPYAIAMTFIMERFMYFLEENNDVGFISIESRDRKANRDVLDVFESIMNNGTGDTGSFTVSAERYRNRIKKIEFITKKQNNNGHQLADLVAYPIARYALNAKRENAAFKILKHKFRNRNGRIEGVGLKIFPQKMGPGYSQSPPF